MKDAIVETLKPIVFAVVVTAVIALALVYIQ